MGLDLEDFDAAIERRREARTRPAPEPGASIMDEDVRGVLTLLLENADRAAHVKAERDRAARPCPPADLFGK